MNRLIVPRMSINQMSQLPPTARLKAIRRPSGEREGIAIGVCSGCPSASIFVPVRSTHTNCPLWTLLDAYAMAPAGAAASDAR